MDRETGRKFISRTESLVKPQDVTAISFLGDFNRLLPKKLQEKVMLKGSATVPYMGFIVDPYCFFLAYRIQDRTAAEAMLPPGYVLAETSVFRDQGAAPLVIIGAFSVRTSAFIGNRLEMYVIARQRDTGRISWIIADYETNTNSYDPKNGFSGYTSDPAVLATSPYGELIADFEGKNSGNAFSLSADLEKGEWRELNQELWVEGNWSIDYGGAFMLASPRAFSLIFDPALMRKALHVPVGNLEIRKNTCLGGLIEAGDPLCAAVFPYSQHFIIRQDLEAGALASIADMGLQAAEFLDCSGFRTMSGDALKKPILAGMLASAAMTYGLIIFLVFLLVSR